MPPARAPRDLRIVVMGVSGAGKSTVGEALADRLGVPFKDGDELHPQHNIDKMAAGHALTDDDRAPWLARVGSWLHDHTPGIIACSALKRAYRDLIRTAAPGTVFVQVHGSYELLLDRMNERPGHFMPASLLDSQFSTLEPLADDETHLTLDVATPVDVLVDEATTWLRGDFPSEGGQEYA